MTCSRTNPWTNPENAACDRQLWVVPAGAMCSRGFQLRPNNSLLDNQIGDKLQDKLAVWELVGWPKKKKTPRVIRLFSLQANTLLASVGIRSARVIVCCFQHNCSTRLTMSWKAVFTPRIEPKWIVWSESVSLTPCRSQMFSCTGSAFFLNVQRHKSSEELR